MRLWWIAVLAVLLEHSTVGAIATPGELPIKDGDGKIVGVVVQCDTCPSTTGSSKECRAGAENGWLDGKPCGTCLIKENPTASLKYSYDLHLMGTLVNPAGEPLKDRFVKLSLANGWTVKTRTSEQGTFRLMLGATEERTSKTPLVIELGSRVDSQPDGGSPYALFLLPNSYKSCPPAAGKRSDPNDRKPH